MRHTRVVLPLSACATALLAASLPVGSAHAEEEPAFSGYSAEAWAAPVKIEIYEPTIPIPATPQAELAIAYTTTEATTGLHKGRSSFLWPGDPIGSGFVTFGEALGLPEAVYENGYPIQVNSVHPGGPDQETDEPFPGTMMRTQASADEVTAVTGYSTDGQPAGDPKSDAGGEGGEAPALPGAPTGTLSDPTQFGAAITGSSGDGETETSSPLPPELAAIVDIGSFTARSSSAPGTDLVTSTAYSALADASLLGGAVTFEGISARTTTTSNGARSDATGGSRVGSITIAGQTFAMGSDGIKAGGQDVDIPGLPDDPDRALAQLGLTVTRPQQDLTSKGLEANGLAEAVQVEIDMVTLKKNLEQVPVGDVIGAIPPNELKDVVSALANLSPRIVITLGNAVARTETITGLDVPVIEPPEVPTEDPGATGGGTGATGGTGSTGGTGGTGSSVPPSSTTPTDGASAAGGDAPAAGDSLEDTALAAGLPALNTIPGALTMGGILLAIGAGTWLRRIGALALGGATSCTHGLDSGLPDLRKA